MRTMLHTIMPFVLLPLAVFCSAANGTEPPRSLSPGRKPTLRVPLRDSKPAIDGTLEEPCWREAARTGPLKVTPGAPRKSITEALLVRPSR